MCKDDLLDQCSSKDIQDMNVSLNLLMNNKLLNQSDIEHSLQTNQRPPAISRDFNHPIQTENLPPLKIKRVDSNELLEQSDEWKRMLSNSSHEDHIRSNEYQQKPVNYRRASGNSEEILDSMISTQHQLNNSESQILQQIFQQRLFNDFQLKNKKSISLLNSDSSPEQQFTITDKDIHQSSIKAQLFSLNNFKKTELQKSRGAHPTKAKESPQTQDSLNLRQQQLFRFKQKKQNRKQGILYKKHRDQASIKLRLFGRFTSQEKMAAIFKECGKPLGRSSDLISQKDIDAFEQDIEHDPLIKSLNYGQLKRKRIKKH